MKRVAQALCALALLYGRSFGQSTTGTLLGVVADPSDAAVPKALIELRNTATGAVNRTTTEAEGIFRFNSLVPASYTLTIKAAAGFKTYTQSNIDVTADEVRDLGKISLAMGALTEQVSVTATTILTTNCLQRELQADRPKPDGQPDTEGPRHVWHDAHIARGDPHLDGTGGYHQ